MAIDYARMQRVWPQQKAALTRAKNAGDPDKVLAVCRNAVAEWNEIGAWPDDWALFQRTLDDAFVKAGRGWTGPQLEEL